VITYPIFLLPFHTGAAFSCFIGTGTSDVSFDQHKAILVHRYRLLQCNNSYVNWRRHRFRWWLTWAQGTIMLGLHGVKIGWIHSQPPWVTSRRCSLLPKYSGHLLLFVKWVIGLWLTYRCPRRQRNGIRERSQTFVTVSYFWYYLCSLHSVTSRINQLLVIK